MSWVAVAIGGSALVGAGASIYASGRQTDAASNALNYQREADARTQGNLAPYMAAGRGALDRVNAVYEGRPGWDNFLQSPDYQFRFGEGVRALDNSAAARGNLLSGNHLRGVTGFGQGLASNEFGNYFGRLMEGARLGQNSAVGAGSLGLQGAGMVGNTMNAAGAASASGAVGAANALNSGVGNYLFYNALSNRSAYAPTVMTGSLPGMPNSPYYGPVAP